MTDKIKTVKMLDDGIHVQWETGEVSTYLLSELPDDIVKQCAIHGLKQKTMDAHAGGLRQYGTVAACRAESSQVYANLIIGVWSTGRTGDGGWVVDALAEVTDSTREDAAAIWADLDEATRKKVRKEPRIVAWKARRDLERAEATESDESILDTI